ncbi:tRNA (N(6)-L-threonylcarbamoyladenosine(37)-C(2))-methylthiotransferase MtaB [Phototrophicus methaneseepsis]|uniref:tRNA (N(6)-L-threonylcarbamoyladenosine(37)-C(2))-methylthiotransferase MtaB n=1 Tax=Phototrophicus methaneseepsis TaxID=2710758 RepID=A0A7S8EDC7_9CHLR|nr:tRNA (N(6)-L-threonylcarbamoyladenosine(37)-C(2))-methylthiotransferase MtaB [Phototrophicus methaneseepsis]QPC84876.1 tRNA (N(6)-L-threonylcarbamoyladenosine(37)-C(2))-methylthiotransferase MtaB [Phototrophicus methaneseepsis]
MKVHLRMLGCRLNQSEIDTMARQLQQQGHEIVESPDEADQVIVNTCAVTAEAVRAGRQMIRGINRTNPNAEITVTGCHAQIAPDQIAVLPGVAHVVDNEAKMGIVPMITGQPIPNYDREPLELDETRPGASHHTRAFVKVQDGCDNACTFCVTTVARGAGRSRDADGVLAEINALYASGYQEIVLTGVHLGSYGYDQGDQDGLMHLVERILAETDVPRVRLSSLEPWDLSTGFFDLWQDSRLCPHLHLPLQSGCDATLKRMRRHTNQAAFRAIVQEARDKIPDVRITSDVIVGFPGETDEEFAVSEAFIHEMAFAGLHVFRYSVRPGTPAARMKNHVSKAKKKARSEALRDHAQSAEATFAQQFAHQSRPILWEQVTGANDTGFINTGYTDNYIRVQAIYPRPLTNHITPAILGTYENGMVNATPVIE